MTNWSPNILAPLSPSQLGSILDDGLRVLDEIGIECAHEGVGRRLAAEDGVSYTGGRIFFSQRRMRDHIAQKRALIEQSAEDDTGFSLDDCWPGLNYCDPETQEVRPASSQEAAQMARMWDARGLSGSVPLLPGDVPPELAALSAERIALMNSSHLGGCLTVTDPEEVRFLIDMNLAASRRYRLLQQVGISPLRFNSSGLEIALHFAGSPDVETIVAGFIPMAGATCPLDPRSALVQSAAETLAHDFLCSALGVSGGGFLLRVEPFDFRYSNIVYGSAEWCLYRALVLQMAEYLMGRKARSGMFRSAAKRPDAQAACERTASALWQALLGVRHFGAVGQLSMDEVFSPQQAVLDREILGYVERVIRGADIASEGADSIALIREGVREGNYLCAANTVSRFRDSYYWPDIFRHWRVAQWRAEGEPSILGEAWAHAREEIAMSTFKLNDAAQKQVNTIYGKACRYVGSRA